MDPHSLYSAIANSTAHRPVRNVLSQRVLNEPSHLPEVVAMAFDTQDKNHHKACWVLELVIEARPMWLQPYLNDFCNALPRFTHESAIRPIAKICMFTAEYDKNHPGFLDAGQLQKIIETCFDRLISPEGKVAAKAYAMRTLYLLGQKENWIYPELRRILEEDFIKHSSGYKAAAKDILRQIP